MIIILKVEIRHEMQVFYKSETHAEIENALLQ